MTEVSIAHSNPTLHVVATFTAQPVEDSLRYWVNLLGMGADVAFADYNQVFQELLDPQSRLNRLDKGASVILVRFEDWRRFAGEGPFNERKTAREFAEALKVAAHRAKVPMVVVLCPPSPGREAEHAELQAFVTNLSGNAPGLHFIGAEEIAEAYPVGQPFDRESDELGHIPYTAPWFAALGTMLARKIHALSRKPYKVVAVDADNTLWKGVVGEVGVEGVEIDDACNLLQRTLQFLQQRGLLVAIVSKNAREDVDAVFARHPAMLLKASEIVGWRVNWQSKSRNLQELARDLELGLDSFIFLDDNPVEVAEVKANAPQVLALQVPLDSVETLDRFLDHVWAFDIVGNATAEDRDRTALYRAQAERAEAQAGSASLQAFLDSLELVVEIETPTRDDYRRLAQLTQRTNQFNTTGLRRTEVEITHVLGTGALDGLKVMARDRFGDYGLVGFLGYYKDGGAVMVENFLLSCRALGKGVEHRMVAALGEAAQALGCGEVHIPFFPSDRNQPAGDFLFGQFPGVAREIPGGPGHVFVIPTETAAATRLVVSDDSLAPASVSASERPASPVVDPKRAATVDWQLVAGRLASPATLVEEIRAAKKRVRPAEMAAPFIAPTTDTDRRLAAIWAEMLAVDDIGIRDDFFALGGQSVLATRVLSRVARDLGVRLPLRAIFDHPTVAELGVALSKAERRAARPKLAAVERVAAGMPLSASQKRMWFLDRYAPGNPAYNIVAAQRLGGRLNLPALRNSLDAMGHRQEILRATFPDRDGQPVQVFGDSGIRILFEDLSELPPDRRWATAMAKSREVAATPFNLATGPLARAHIYRLDLDDHLLVFNIHHIISDGWSMDVFFRDLSAFYQAFAGRRVLQIDPLGVQHLDVAVWQDECFKQGAFADDLTYWQERLKNAPEALNLPTDFARPAERTFAGAVASRRLPANFSRAIEGLAKRENTTLFMLLMAAWQAFLYRWSGQEDILVGTPIAGRTDAEMEPLIGCFINTLVFRACIDGATPFRDHLARVREQTLESFAHQELPFDKLVETLSIKRSIAHSPLFQVMFVLQNTEHAPLELAGLQTLAIPLHNGTAKFDLVLEAVPHDDGLEFNLEFNTALFRPDTAERMLQCFSTLLYSITQAAGARIGDFNLLDEAETRRLVYDFNRHEDRPPSAPTVHQWFEAVARAYPTARAATCAGETWTYDELNRRANRIAHALQERGVRRSTPVAICMERSLDLLAGLLGILKAGGCYVPIDLSYPADRLAFMLEDTQALVLVTQRSLVPKLPPHNAGLMCLDDWHSVRLHEFPDTNPVSGADAESLCYIIYTSGSTGRPKGCCITHHNVGRLFSSTHAWFRFDQRDVWTLFHSYAFDFSVWEIWGALLFGGRVVVVPYLVSRSPEDFYQLLEAEKVTVLNQTPSAFRQLIAAEQMSGRTADLALRYVIFGGEALEMQSLKPWFDRHGDAQPQLVNMYGITETTVHVTYRPLSARDVHGGSVIGVPIPDLRVYVLDRDMKPCPIGVPGEMFVGGAGVAQGYLNREELTAQRFVPSPFVRGDRLYRTGDLARFLPDRDIEYLGRIDRQVKIRGFRIELGEIESVLLQHPRIREAAVVALDGPSGKYLAAYLVPAVPTSAVSLGKPSRNGRSHAAADTPALDELRGHLKQQLPDYMVPAAWVFVPKFPLTANGKLDTVALPAPEMERAAETTEFIGPRTEAEAMLAGIWQKVLRLERVGMTDNFFALGGDSILTIQVISQARQAGFAVAPKHLFEHQSIGELASVIAPHSPRLTVEPSSDSITDESAKAEPAPASTASASGESEVAGDVPLTPIQQWFLRQEFHGQDYWNQAFLFSVARDLDVDRLRQALQTVVDHHDAFRLRLSRTPGGWRQYYAPKAGDILLEAVDGTALGPASDRAQQSLDLIRGPLVRFVYSRANPLRTARLFIAAHHLCIDGVSWRILLEDIESAYHGQPLPLRTASFQTWAAGLVTALPHFRKELDRWRETLSEAEPALPPDAASPGPNTESSVHVFRGTLSMTDTDGLLRRVPSAWRAQVNDVLLAALAMAFRRLTKKRTLTLHLEGHGREDSLGDHDVSRTVGWFTSLFPVRLELPESMSTQDALKAVKEQLRAIPNKGVGYGLLRFLGDDGSGLQDLPQPDVVFNYLGQLDGMVAGSSLFGFAPEPTAEWHHPRAHRVHAIEVDCSVRNGAFAAEFRLSENLHRPETGGELARAFISALQQLVAICGSPGAGGYTPSDLPLSGLNQQMVDLVTTGRTDVDDIVPLSPMQGLFFSLAQARGHGVGIDQWRCRLLGPLDVDLFRQAWTQVVNRHSLLRTSILTTGLQQPLALIHTNVAPPWKLDDLRWLPRTERDRALGDLLVREAQVRPDPAKAPLSRFTLVRLDDAEHAFVWSVPDLHLDGWSWPIVFREVADVYSGLVEKTPALLPPARPYSDFIAWQRGHDAAQHEGFWRETLSGLQRPTAVPIDKADAGAAGANREVSLLLPADEWDGLVQLARNRGVTPGALFMTAWAIILSKGAADDDVTFGAAFSGRPAELPGVGGIVGPFVNNLPVRFTVDPEARLTELFRIVRDRIFAISEHQFPSPVQIQDWSSIPWRHRLFDSLIVVQNYEVDAEARRLGEKVTISDFHGPTHNNYPIMLVATPGDGLELTLVYQENRVSRDRADQLLHDVSAVLGGMIYLPADASVGEVAALATLPAGCSKPRSDGGPRQRLRPPVAPRNDLEKRIHAVWLQAFGGDVGVEDNFFDAGGHSLLALRVLAKLRDELNLALAPADLFQFPTIASLAAHVGGTSTPRVDASAAQNRAAMARAAMQRR